MRGGPALRVNGRALNIRPPAFGRQPLPSRGFAAIHLPRLRRWRTALAAWSLGCADVAGFVAQHHGNAVADGEGEAGGAADQLVGLAVIGQRRARDLPAPDNGDLANGMDMTVLPWITRIIDEVDGDGVVKVGPIYVISLRSCLKRP